MIVLVLCLLACERFSVVEGFLSLQCTRSTLLQSSQSRFPLWVNALKAPQVSSTTSMEAEIGPLPIISIFPVQTRDILTNMAGEEEPIAISNAPIFTKKRSMVEVAALSSIGVFLGTGIVYTLASTMGTTVVEKSGGRLVFVVEAAEEVGSNIIDAAFPLTATDAVTSALGEATAGIAAALSYFFLSLFLNDVMEGTRRTALTVTTSTQDEQLGRTNGDTVPWQQRLIEQEQNL